MKKRIAIVAGTRPEAIKMASVYLEMKRSDTLDPVFISTAQHRQMLDSALEIFGIKSDFDMNVMRVGQTLNELTSRLLSSWNDFYASDKPDALLVQGDTTTVLASALAAFYEHIPIGHVEAGLRTGNMNSPFPEEMNRRLTTPLANWNFCPTPLSRENLLNEGVNPHLCHVVGNTVIDALLKISEEIDSECESLQRLCSDCAIPNHFAEKYFRSGEGSFILVTGHRRENFGTGFENICMALKSISAKYPDVGILYPVHMNPNVREPVNRILGGDSNIALVPPVDYKNFVHLMKKCRFIISDSGGIQEEAPTLGKPVLVMRDTTERPEGLQAGTCKLVGTDVDTIVSSVDELMDDDVYMRRSSLKNPYGDGKSGNRIVKILEESFD